MRSLLFVLALVIGLAGALGSASAQTIDPYRRLTDPRAITYLDGDDVEPLRYSTGVAWPAERDTGDFYFIVAKEEGAGILTHIWMQLQDKPDSAAVLKIYIDDSLIFHDFLYYFFERTKGVLRPPLDSVQSGGLVCDVQMPFKRNFKITFMAGWEYCCLFRAVGWRPVLDPSLVESFRPDPSSQLAAQQEKAEEVYWSGESPWKGTPVEIISMRQVITKQAPLEQLIVGPGLLTELHIKPAVFDSIQLRNVWLQFFWDGSPQPSVDVPIADFFGQGAGQRNVRAHSIRAMINGTLTSYFPMPFAVGAKMRIINKTDQPVELDLAIKYSKEPIDRSRMGYFQTQFNERKVLKYSIAHPAAYHQGRGRFVGLQLYLPKWEPGYFLEGDPLFHVDSSWWHYTQYTGTEDYFNGGWFFSDGPFSLPFAGCTAIHTSLYRFHYMDAIDFKKSFELNIQHGVQNDFKAWYRTVGYLYTLWTPFWSSLDTVARGQSIAIGGAGYLPNKLLNVSIGDHTFEVMADENGRFSTSVTIPSSLNPGGYFLTIDNEQRPEPLWITDGPDVYFIRDTFPSQVRWGDTMTVFGNGFEPGQQLRLFADSVPLLYDGAFTADLQGKFNVQVRVPRLADGEYSIVARAPNYSELATSIQKLSNTRTWNFEIENLWPPVLAEGDHAQDYMGYFWNKWSEQYYAFFRGDLGKTFKVKFSLVEQDTFDVKIFLTRGVRFGDYMIQLDDLPPVPYFGYEDRDFYDPIRSGPIDLGTHYLAKGEHFLTFYTVSKHPSATEYLLGADNIELRPTTKFTNPIAGVARPLQVPDLIVYPNPASDQVTVQLPESRTAGRYEVEIYRIDGTRISTYAATPEESGALLLSTSQLVAGTYYVRVWQDGATVGIASFAKR